jgi:hypothetical protein
VRKLYFFSAPNTVVSERSMSRARRMSKGCSSSI